ncbi:hypothetical protein [Actinomadura litoris]|uniref:Uncharacterized protein n=1 Tax=Actinomadura litoris TaxID=2678616 RepID=A0A7K1LB64_9ACTN|nr:hypothetical protein [Actinomadura litoris]MUN41667.1 hypothetical protein [Actinomadura litoris]
MSDPGIEHAAAISRLMQAAVKTGAVWARTFAVAAPGGPPTDEIMATQLNHLERGLPPLAVVWVRHARSFTGHSEYRIVCGGDSHETLTTYHRWTLELADLVERSSTPWNRLQAAWLRRTAAHHLALQFHNTARGEIGLLDDTELTELDALIFQGGMGSLTAADLTALRTDRPAPTPQHSHDPHARARPPAPPTPQPPPQPPQPAQPPGRTHPHNAADADH